MKTKPAIIVAYAKNHVIGHRGQIPWLGQIPADMQRLRQLTLGQAIVMGLNTFRSIRRALPGRQNIVLVPSGENFRAENVQVAHSLEQAFSLVEADRTAFIFGGGQVYQAAIDMVETIYATEVIGDFSGDTYFPEIDSAKWREVSRQHHPADADNKFAVDFVEYARR